ncbi:MAG: GtrA family protein [Oscillospiraceae bacterium]|nr:GtrA family protein [Oscillospiraceae bacterium]MBQ8732160.1 GtrA family protein [Oscillospiraceae bacterium]
MNFKKLFVEDTNNTFIQFFRFIFVGGTATVVDMLVGLLFRNLVITAPLMVEIFSQTVDLQDVLSGAAGFLFGLVANYFLTIIWVFKRDDINRVKEFTVFAIIGLVGLVINSGVMALCGLVLTEGGPVGADLLFLIKKAIATLVTLIWNFTARKLILYRNK